MSCQFPEWKKAFKFLIENVKSDIANAARTVFIEINNNE